MFMFDVTGVVIGVGATPQWCNLRIGYRRDLTCLIIKTLQWASCLDLATFDKY